MIYHCPWCVVTERGARAGALMRKHILEAHRKLITHIGDFHAAKLFQLLRKVGYRDIGSSSTRKTLDPPRNAANPRRPLNRGVSGEGNS